ncbi:MAG: CRISPR-associated endonuclease Cas2 [Thermoguttaceae bacterium]|jgi:CRISPR-associated protein Cas2
MFDLPVDTKKARRAYTDFVRHLKRDGFTRMQFSVYARHSPSKENAAVHINRIQANLPPDGEVRIITITDKQFERMSIFWGNMRKAPEEPPCQLQLF